MCLGPRRIPVGAFHIMNEKGSEGLTYCSLGLCMGVDVLFCGVAGSLNSRSCFIVQFVIGMVVYLWFHVFLFSLYFLCFLSRDASYLSSISTIFFSNAFLPSFFLLVILLLLPLLFLLPPYLLFQNFVSHWCHTQYSLMLFFRYSE